MPLKIANSLESAVVIMLAGDLLVATGPGWWDLVWIPMLVLLVLAVTRRGSRVARIVLTTFYAAAGSMAAYLTWRGLLTLGGLSAAGWAAAIIWAVQLGLLWSPAMTRWMRMKRDLRSSPG